ncbi:bile acid:sodium symporter family protein [Chloroflexus sp.]|uniref:bile acid:sodium symporter family protein n=1 Tax=Chloroflexus sp. TaxID=1904827 RepID=UPI00404B68C2
MNAMLRAAKWVRRHYQAIILTALVISFAAGAVTTAPGRTLQPYTQTLTFFMILFISYTITPRQFLTVSRQPWPVLAGLALNFLFMPLLAWGLTQLLVNNPDFAVGLILVGVVPCAGMAAVWTALLKGDVPLSMAINALSMAILAGTDVAISTWGMFQQLAVILLAPLALGLGLRWLSDRFWDVKPLLPLLPALLALTAVLLMFTVTNLNAPLIMRGQARAFQRFTQDAVSTENSHRQAKPGQAVWHPA